MLSAQAPPCRIKQLHSTFGRSGQIRSHRSVRTIDLKVGQASRTYFRGLGAGRGVRGGAQRGPGQECGITTSPHPDQGRPPPYQKGGHCGGHSFSVTQWVAAVAETKWRAFVEQSGRKQARREAAQIRGMGKSAIGTGLAGLAVLVASPGPPPAIGGSGRWPERGF
jgi:hypothetical protein